MTTCPKCNHERIPSAIECPKCGSLYDKYGSYGERRRQGLEKETSEDCVENGNKKAKDGKESRFPKKKIKIILWVSICLIYIVIGILHYLKKQDARITREIEDAWISTQSTESTSKQSTPPTSPEGDILDSLQASINYLSKPKFVQNGILNATDDGSAVHITIQDSFWYNLTTSQQQQLANRLLDVIYASGDVKRILYLKDQSSRVIAEQRTERTGPTLTFRPYMNLM